MGVEKLTYKILYEACKQHIDIFAYWMLGITLRDYQRVAIDLMRKHNDVSMAWSRRTGKSTVTKIFMLHSARFNTLPGDLTGTTWNVLLQDQEIANSLYIEPIHEMMEKGDQVVAKNFNGFLGTNFFTDSLVTRRDKSGKVRVNQISFKMEDGQICRINTMPPTNKAIGREGNIIGDEVSKWKNNPKCKDEFNFYDQLIAIKKDKPHLKAIFLTTPEGDQDMFAKLIFDPEGEDPNNNYVKVWYPWQVRNDEQWQTEMKRTKADAIRKKRLPMFRQEYEASFETISDPYFDSQLLKDRQDDKYKKDYSQIPCAMGIDWGGSAKSETVITITEWTTKPEDRPKTIYQKAYPVGEDLIYLEKDLAKLKTRYPMKWVVPDNKGARWMIPRLEKMFGKSRVQPFNFTTEKQEGYDLLRDALTANKARIPAIKELNQQLAGLNDKLKPSNAKLKDDRADSYMLSWYPLLKHKQKEFRVLRY